jgi:hypothetical protein
VQQRGPQEGDLLDHLVGTNEYRGWHGEPERFGRLHVDCQLELRRLLNRQISGFCSLSPDITDRATLAILHVLIDPAAAGLVFAGSMMRRWGWNREGRWFQIIAVLLIVYSMLSVYGFMSARFAVTQSHDALIAYQKGKLNWTYKSIVNSEIPKGERRLLRADAKEIDKEIKASLAFIPDAQAASIADAFGIAVAKVQRTLVMISSGAAQAIKYVCLLCGVMIWPRRQSGGLDKTDKADKSSSGIHVKHFRAFLPDVHIRRTG